jgi:two-component system chemotaxis sensor kinase CheA
LIRELFGGIRGWQVPFIFHVVRCLHPGKPRECPPENGKTMTDHVSQEHLELVGEFALEIRDLLDELEPVIIDMGKSCGQSGQLAAICDDINSVFRLFHSIKGGAGFLNFSNIAATSHSAENLLDLIRTGSMALQPEHVDLFCKGCDFIRAAVEHVSEHFNDEDLGEQSAALRQKFMAAIATDHEQPQPVVRPGPAPVIDLDLLPVPQLSPELAAGFISESQDILQILENDLLTLLEDQGNEELLKDIFRQIHSFKGNCGFLGFADLEMLSHHLETAMDLARSEGEVDAARIADLALKLIDVYRETLADISTGGAGRIDGLAIYLDLINDLLPPEKRLLADGAQGAERLGDILVEQGAVSRETVEGCLAQQQKKLGEILVESGMVRPEQVDLALETQSTRKKNKAAVTRAAAPARQDIRVDLGKLDQLIDLVGELVIAENMVVNNPDLLELDLDSFQKSSQHLGKIIRDLQEMAMTLRMVPVSGLFRRMIRLVHDLSRKSGKKVDLILSGEDTEVDKTVIETITDPLVHLLRNSMDHGIEAQEVRQAAGKNSTGTIRLAATHEEGTIKISIEDDGGGLPRDKILAKAREKGLIRGDGAEMADSEVFGLIFAPGFSTAAAITDVSGRGVGMDVVRQNINKVNGTVDIKSKAGQGTTVELRIPLTLAIIEGMLVRSGPSRYIIPIINIIESFQAKPRMITIGPDGQEVVKVRGSLLPVVRLHELHHIVPDHRELEKGILIVLEARGSNFCLFVDELLGQQQTVIKGLSDYVARFGNVGGVSGCTIMGNGEVCLILDVQSVFDRRGEGRA